MKGNIRKPLTGALHISVLQARDLDRPPIASKFSRSAKTKPEAVVVIKIEDTPRARTHPVRNDRWGEDFVIHVDKANEVEVTIYDKASGEMPIPIGLLWIRLSDVVEELRKRRVGQDASGPGWVTAARVEGGGSNSMGSGSAFGSDVPVGQQMNQAFPGSAVPGAPGSTAQPEGVNAWFAVEPEGQIQLQLNFCKLPAYNSVQAELTTVWIQ